MNDYDRQENAVGPDRRRAGRGLPEGQRPVRLPGNGLPGGAYRPGDLRLAGSVGRALPEGRVPDRRDRNAGAGRISHCRGGGHGRTAPAGWTGLHPLLRAQHSGGQRADGAARPAAGGAGGDPGRPGQLFLHAGGGTDRPGFPQRADRPGKDPGPLRQAGYDCQGLV